MSSGALVLVLLGRFVILSGVIAYIAVGDSHPKSAEWYAIVLGALGTYFVTYAGDYYSFLRGRSRPNANDVALFNELQELMNPQSVLPMFCGFHFGGSFEYNKVIGVMEFADSWDKADKEFVDRKMEKARMELFGKAAVVATNLAKFTSPSKRLEGFQTVQMHQFSDDEQPQRVWDEANIINASAREFAKSYEELIRLGKSRLAV
jgi:hypothetical protein